MTQRSSLCGLYQLNLAMRHLFGSVVVVATIVVVIVVVLDHILCVLAMAVCWIGT